MRDWQNFLGTLLLLFVRLSGVVAFAPFFTSTAIPVRAKAVFVLVVAYLLAPLAAVLAPASAGISLPALAGELAVGMLYGLSLALLNEMLLFAGQIIGLQFSFSLVNLLDPASQIQTPLLGELMQLMGTLVLLAAGMDRILLDSLVRSLHAVPPGSFVFSAAVSAQLVSAASGVFMAALELAAPVLGATLIVEVAIAIVSRISPQLPVMSLTVPLKTITGYVVLIGSLALWPQFIESRFSALLDLAERLIAASARHALPGGA